MNKCRTMPLFFADVSGCLVDEPVCSYAGKSGFSFVCCHIDHKLFSVIADGSMSHSEACERYEQLRQKRRDEFVAQLDGESRSCFNAQID